MQFLLLVAGLVLIAFGSELLVHKAVKLARVLRIPSFIVGITIVAFGTSIPELVVGIISAAEKSNALAFGNVAGSGVTNICLTVGLCAVFLPLPVLRGHLRGELPMMLFAAALMGVLVLDGRLSRADGAILLGCFALFLFYVLLQAKKSAAPAGEPDSKGSAEAFTAVDCLVIAASLVLLLVAGRLIVTAGGSIAAGFGFSKEAVGATIVALGTCMPEFMASLSALRRREPGIILGNCIGSNIFNVFAVLGSSCLISPIPSVTGGLLLSGFFAGAALLLLLFALIFKKIGKLSGGVLLSGYFLFMIVVLAPR